MRWVWALSLGIFHGILGDDCTFQNYGYGYSNANKACYSWPDCSGALPSGVPTFYGTVENVAGQPINIFEKWSATGAVSADYKIFDTVDNHITAIENTQIRICKNNNENPSDSQCQDNDGANQFAESATGESLRAQSVFEIVNGQIRIKESVNLKSWGGPRHELILTTDVQCTVTLRLFISPSENSGGRTVPEISFLAQDDVCIVDNLKLPSCSVRSNGVPLEFVVNEYDNIVCLYTELYSEQQSFDKLYFYTVDNMSVQFEGVDFEVSDIIRIEGPTMYSNDQYNDAVKNMNSFYLPNDPKCTFTVYTSVVSVDAIQYEDIKSGELNIAVEIVGRVNQFYLKSQITDFDMSTAYAETAELNLVQDTTVYDINDMPPIFLDGITCTEEDLMANSQCIASPIEKTITRDDCIAGGTNAVILTIGSGGDVDVKDGDTGITPEPAISVTISSNDFELNSATGAISCPGDTASGQYIFNIIATEDLNQWRYSSMALVVNVVDNESYDIDEIITKPDESATYTVSAYGPSFVTNVDTGDIMQYGVEKPDGVDVLMISNDVDFAIDNMGRVIYVGSPATGRATRSQMAFSIILTADDNVIQSDFQYIVEIEIDDIALDTTTSTTTTTASPTTPTASSTTGATTTAMSCPTYTPPVECPTATPEPCDCPTTPAILSTTSGECPTCTPTVDCTTQPIITSTSGECPTFAPCEPSTCSPTSPSINTTGITTTTGDGNVDCPLDCDEEDELFYILTLVFGALSGTLLIILIILACCCQCRNDDDLEGYPSDELEMRKTIMMDSASVTSDTDDIENIPMPRPEVNINHTLVKATAAVGVANTAFTKDDNNTDIKPPETYTKIETPKVQPKAVPVVKPEPIAEVKPAPVVKLVPIKVVSKSVEKLDSKKPASLGPGTIHDRLKDPMYHTLSDNQITMKGVIKVGKISSVRECTLRNTRDNELKSAVAVTLNVASATETQYQEITERIRIYNNLAKMKHDNILTFYGTWVENDSLHMGFEFAERGKLVDYLRQKRQAKTGTSMSTLTNYQILKILTELGQGLAHLHQRNIIHGNLQGSSVYLTDENIPKLSGMTNNKIKQSNNECKRWWAPEVFATNKHTKESDVWSFGILMWEICTFGGLPYSNISINDIEEHVKFERLPMPSNVSPDIYAFMANCWKREINKRPDANQIVVWLQERLISDTSNSFKRSDQNFVHEPVEPKVDVKQRPTRITSVYRDTTSKSAF